MLYEYGLQYQYKRNIHRLYGTFRRDRHHGINSYYYRVEWCRKKVSAEKAAGISLVIFIAFLFAGDGLLKLFNIDISSFALAGALVLFVLAIEMTFSIEIFRNDGPEGSATIVPVIFPLIAGAGALATTLTLKAECSVFSIIIAILLNMTVVYVVLRTVYLVERVLGKGGVYILRKFFGIILLAMSVKIFASNLNTLLASLS